MPTSKPNEETDLLESYIEDLPTYGREALAIVDKAANLVPFELNFAQRVVHDRLSKQMRETGRIRAIVLKARQEGVSTYTAARGFRRLNLRRNQNGLVVADLQRRGQVLFSIYENFHRNLPDWLRPQKRYTRKGSELWYDLPEGGGLNSKIAVGTANDVHLARGSTVHFLHASEFAFWEHPEETWVALMQAVPDQGSEVIIESTANGVGNTFHTMWEDAVSGNNGFIPIFLPWWIHEEYEHVLTPEQEAEIRATATPWERQAMETGIEWEGELHPLSPGRISWRRETIRDKLRGDERMFRQEYPATAREAFLVSGNLFFDDEALTEYEERAKEPKRRGNLAWVDGGIAIIPAERGYLKVWELPRLECTYVVFGDTASGKKVSSVERSVAISEETAERGGLDYSCADVFCTTHFEQVAQLHGRMAPEVFADQVYMLGYLYSGPRPGSRTIRTPALIGVERNHSSGETVLRLLQDDYNYPNLYVHRQINRRTQRRTNVVGWVTTTENRQVMLDELSQAIREGSIGLPSADTIRECFTFVRNDAGKPEAQEGCHDDRVISAAGSVQLARYWQPRVVAPQDEIATADTPTGWATYG